MLRVGVAIATVLYLVILAGQVYDLAKGTGSLSGVYIEKQSDNEVRVSGFRTGVDELGGLQIGDVILHVGARGTIGKPRRPDGVFDFRYALDVADGQMLIRRNGELREIRYELQRYRWPAVIVLRTLALGLLAVVMLVYSSGALAQTAAIGFLLTACLGQGAPIGPSGSATAVLTVTWCIGQAICFPSWIHVVQRIINPSISRRQLIWPWLISVIGAVLYMNYTGVGLPHEVPWLLYTILVFSMLAIVLGLTHRGYRHATPLGRRQIQWALAAALTAVIMLAVAVIIDFLNADSYSHAFLFVAGFGNIVIPIAFVIGILKADVIPIDRAIVTTATYAIIVVVLALALEFLVEPLAGFASTYLGMNESTGQTILIVGIALGAPYAKQRIQPHVVRLLRRYETEELD